MGYSLPSLKHLVLISSLYAASIPSVAADVDYVIVGGGPAGYVVAEQLSRNSSVTVTLLDVGPDGDADTNINVPAYFIYVRSYLWDYNSEPDSNLGGQTPNLWQGRALGGGTAVNGMTYCRGASSVFDEWADISGNPGLAWKSLLNDFKATTHYTYQPADYEQTVDTSVYGDGPLEVSRTSGLTGIELPFAQVMEQTLGIPRADLTDGTGIGVDLGLQTIRVSNRTRSYARNTFGYLFAGRSNVQVLANSWVQRIGFSGTTATNVTYINTETDEVSTLAAKEIIVSGGVLNSPKLLLQSGVGPKDTLTALGIPVVADIKGVGANLWDHHFSFIIAQATSDIIDYWQWAQNATEAEIAREKYAEDGSGPLGWANGATYGAARIPDSVFTAVGDTHYPSLDSDRPHVMFQFSGFPVLQSAPNVSIVSAWSTLVQPEASGYLTINSSDYRDPPVLYSNYYGSEGDKAAIKYAYKQLRSMFDTDPLKQHVVQEIYPGANVTADDELWEAIQKSAVSFHHAVGTVALGSVLDKNWRIKGLDGIRVVDSSAIPTLPTCHVQAHVYAIAHRAALDIIEADGIGGY